MVLYKYAKLFRIQMPDPTATATPLAIASFVHLHYNLISTSVEVRPLKINATAGLACHFRGSLQSRRPIVQYRRCRYEVFHLSTSWPARRHVAQKEETFQGTCQIITLPMDPSNRTTSLSRALPHITTIMDRIGRNTVHILERLRSFWLSGRSLPRSRVILYLSRKVPLHATFQVSSCNRDEKL